MNDTKGPFKHKFDEFIKKYMDNKKATKCNVNIIDAIFQVK